MLANVISIDDLSDDDIQRIFALADGFLNEMASAEEPNWIRGQCNLGQKYILSTLFFEPSTRTRMSFETAMLRLGGGVVSMQDSKASSMAKGETIADTIRVVESYADIIVIRHPWEGAARVAADYARVPIINAGDGSHEHPTQTLVDLYTLHRAYKEQLSKEGENGRDKGGGRFLNGLNVLLYGDLRHGRTVHSLVYALARFGARIIPRAAPGCELPEHVEHRLAMDYKCLPIQREDLRENSLPDNVDVIYVTRERQNQLPFKGPDVYVKLSHDERESLSHIKVDVFYATRLQTERKSTDEEAEPYPAISASQLKGPRYKHSKVMHPLPRVDELSFDLDQDVRGVYFQQAAYGVPIRMALITHLLGLKQEAQERKPVGARYPEYTNAVGIRCDNPKCVSEQESEKRYLIPRFYIIDAKRLLLRCAYCDYEQMPKVVGKSVSKKYSTDLGTFSEGKQGGAVLFKSKSDAEAAGYEERLTARKMSDEHVEI